MPHWDSSTLLDGLTSSQQAAVTHQHGPLLLVAGPGSGKTHTMTRRIAWLIASGLAKPSEILALTFTRAAAGEMRSRLIGLLDNHTVKQLRAGTFHSVAVQILRDRPADIGRAPEFTIYDQEDTRRIIRRLQQNPTPHVEALTAQAGTIEPPEVVAQIGLAKSRMWTADDLESDGEHPQRCLIAGLWRELEYVLQGNNALDFDDLINNTALLLRDHDDVRQQYRRRWSWILVDEFQDTNPAQAEMLLGLCGRDGNLSVVGDVDQAIFGFRLADPKYMLEFSRRFGDTSRAIVLEENFRSCEEVVATAQRSIEHNTARLPKPVVVTRGAAGDGAVTFHRFAGDTDEAGWIAAMIRNCLAAGIEPNEIMVIARVRNALRQIEQALTLGGAPVPYRMLGGIGLFERKEMREAIAHLKVLANATDGEAFITAASAMDDLGPVAIGAVLAHAAAASEQLDMLDDQDATQAVSGDLLRCCARADLIPSLTGPQRAALMRFGRALLEARDDLFAERSIVTVVNKALGFPGGPVHRLEETVATSPDPKKRDTANKALSDLRSITDAAGAYAKEISEDEPPSIGGFLDHILVDDALNDDNEDDQRVLLASGHKSKGLEARVVFVIGCEEGTLPHYRALESSPKEVEEERRLFYVAATRAKDRLALCCADERTTPRGRRRTDGPSRFLQEAAGLAA
ncbi:MAG: ATP-dependent helicase [Solirubrobacteraceae bacterium]|nr:ATP-dependent helicase [Solirubrobacteraceae bacterium]